MDGIDAFGGASLNEVGVGFHGPTPYPYMDALQISDDEDAFYQVTKIPPPEGTMTCIR